jgi:ribosome-associated toxin RatA of RatAB toxin-antitoxin module
MLQQLYNIDVYPTYKMFLNELGTYCSTTKGRDGILLKNLTIKKQDIRQEFRENNINKPNAFQKAVGNYKENQQDSGW